MGTAITYGLPPERKNVYLASVIIKKQAGKYSLEPLTPQGDCEPSLADKVQQALDGVVAELNGE
jgi:hypothetical protein